MENSQVRPPEEGDSPTPQSGVRLFLAFTLIIVLVIGLDYFWRK